MNDSAKKILTAGITLISAAAIAIAPSVAPPTPRPPAVQLSAAVQPFSQQPNPIQTVVGVLERIVIPPSLGAAIPTPPTIAIPAPTSIGGTIKNVYNVIEPWIRYGFDLAAYAVGWIPYVGWLAPQITIFYNFGERIARSITFNIADWLDGKITFGQGLINVGIDTVNSFIQLGIDQLNFWLPPLPPLPPFPLAVKQTPLTAVQALTPALVPAGSATAAATTSATPNAANPVGAVGRESRSGPASVVGTIKSVAQPLLSTSQTRRALPNIGLLGTNNATQPNGKRLDGAATKPGNGHSKGKK